MRLRQEHRSSIASFEDYGFTAADYKAHENWILHGGPKPEAETLERVRQWNADTFDARQALDAAQSERVRAFWFALWTLVGLAALMLFGALLADSFNLHLRHGDWLAPVTVVAGVLGLIGRENYRRR